MAFSKSKFASIAFLFILETIVLSGSYAAENSQPQRPVSFTLTQTEKFNLGKAIAKRELGSEGLIDWRPSEDFASVGIMHGTWGSEKTIKHQNGFIQFLNFATTNGHNIPEFLIQNKENPWATREKFIAAKYSNDSKMVELQNFLEESKNLQIDFVIDRASRICNKILSNENYNKNDVEKFRQLIKNVEGIFAIIDYVNFKGEGDISNPSSWGLANVLHNMAEPEDGNELEKFIEAARQVLAEKHPKYSIYKQGWINRLRGYPKAVFAA